MVSKTIKPLIGLAMVAGLVTGCVSESQQIQSKEDHLAAAGFAVKAASTPKQQTMLNSLPQHRFIKRVKGDKVFYVYADTAVCDCLYVGDQAAYDHYQQYRQAKALADEQQMTAIEYQNAEWDWGGWGPWGPGWTAWNPAWGNWDPGMYPGW